MREVVLSFYRFLPCAKVKSRSDGNGCPYCTGRYPIVGETDLATVNPILASELADDLNDGLTAKDLTAHSRKKVNWRCVEGHIWFASVDSRSNGNGCPYCTGKLPVIGKCCLCVGLIKPIHVATLNDQIKK